MFPRLRYFRREEFDHPDKIYHRTLRVIDEVRARIGAPIQISSDGRPDDDGPHSRFTALDFYPDPFNAVNRIAVCRAVGELYDEGAIPRLGFGVYDGHFHIDSDPILKRPHFWVGESS